MKIPAPTFVDGMQQIRRNAKYESEVFKACFITNTLHVGAVVLKLEHRQQILLNTYLWSLIQSFCFSISCVGPKFTDASAGPGITFSEKMSLRIIKNKTASPSAGSPYSLALSQLSD